ncbi:single-stranded-DNA-specific exonuclease C-terminal domain-containing protein [Streptococcus equi subsp. equi]|nr:single-stranded-DNA-specific exonuclease C-terminal domain-containing protein [Streptococcus equi subsp. equi]
MTLSAMLRFGASVFTLISPSSITTKPNSSKICIILTKRIFSIEKILLVKMIQIFEELGFVVIEDGLMRVKTDAPKRSIADSVIYQQLKELVKFQELMALGSPQEIYQYLMTSEEK